MGHRPRAPGPPLVLSPPPSLTLSTPPAAPHLAMQSSIKCSNDDTVSCWASWVHSDTHGKSMQCAALHVGCMSAWVKCIWKQPSPSPFQVPPPPAPSWPPPSPGWLRGWWPPPPAGGSPPHCSCRRGTRPRWSAGSPTWSHPESAWGAEGGDGGRKLQGNCHILSQPGGGEGGGREDGRLDLKGGSQGWISRAVSNILRAGCLRMLLTPERGREVREARNCGCMACTHGTGSAQLPHMGGCMDGLQFQSYVHGGGMHGARMHGM